ncbi:hypothetical protein DDI74_01380 [Chryseobacterium gleum]|uniref:hypothetical protein n=1 Tax=Chryseobacterium gleum TaxID=250 RepID=UPI0010402AE4|nr:hypothetical protein [Chryseobacterium gleum]QBJ84992.1 hypothetical protein DDI74_01380 [Chryseobacterium gleum]
MKNKIITCLFLQIGTFTLAQVGINTATPQASLDITAKNIAGTSSGVDGLLIPRIDRQRAQSMTGVAVSTLVYVNNVTTGTAAGTAINIDTVGYYYFDNNVWNKMDFTGQNIYNTNGTLTGNRTVNQAASNLAFTSTATGGTSHFTVDGTTLNVDAVNNRVGIGTNTPNSDLQIVGNEVRVGGPSTQAGTVANPVLRLHSNANADGSGSSLLFSENAANFGYYIRHNTEGGNTYGNDGLAIGAAQTGKYAYNPARPGVFISDVQNVGFGTATPQAMFHIDGGRDNNINSAPTVAQQVNDIVVNTSGNVGIGTTAPSTKLHITSATNGAVQIVDGTQGASKILTSDANGLGTWQTPSTQSVTGIATSGSIDIPFANSTTFTATGNKITLPPGKWAITITQLIRVNGTLTADQKMFVRSTFSDETLAVGAVGTQSTDVIRPTLMSFSVAGPITVAGNTVENVVTGSVFINNTSGVNKTYTYIVGQAITQGNPPSSTYISGYGANWSENALYAIAIN